MTPEQKFVLEKLISEMIDATPEQRVNIMTSLCNIFCPHCGLEILESQFRCHCQNDE